MKEIEKVELRSWLLMITAYAREHMKNHKNLPNWDYIDDKNLDLFNSILDNIK